MTTRTRDERFDSAAAALWASAFLILALVIVQAGRLGAGRQAHAELVAPIGDLTILTASSGDNEDVLLVLDSRAQTLIAYTVVNRSQIDLNQTADVSALFAGAKAGADTGGRRR